jgi:hypothetical protein
MKRCSAEECGEKIERGRDSLLSSEHKGRERITDIISQQSWMTTINHSTVEALEMTNPIK